MLTGMPGIPVVPRCVEQNVLHVDSPSNCLGLLWPNEQCTAVLTIRCTLCADPYVNDATFALSMVFLEELGATGNKVWYCLLHAT